MSEYRASPRIYLMKQTIFLCMRSPVFSHSGSTCTSPSLVPPPFNTTITHCSRSMPHNSHPTKTHPALAQRIPHDRGRRAV
ncbi:hypothetical protein BGW80DRAFT_591859 [Lactifluus volemus]|nr:hypothetical protein BGW80DRAFT_591859 [Lactifluus volemus]